MTSIWYRSALNQGNCDGIQSEVPPCRRKRYRWLAAGVLCLLVSALATPALLHSFRLREVRQALQQRDGARATRLLGPLLESSPDDPELLFLEARAFRRLGKLGDASASLSRAGLLGYRPSAIRREQILALAQAGRMSEAGPELQTLLLNPGDDGAEICEAFVAGYFLNYQMAPGLLILDAWERDFPQDPEPHVFRGKYYEHTSAWGEASREYRRALEISPDSLEIRKSYADMLLELNEYPSAQSEFEKCRQKAPRDAAVLIGHARCLRVAGDSEGAIRDLRTALEAEPENAEAMGVLGETELQSGQTAEALKQLIDAARLAPHNLEIRFALANAYQASGNGSAAAEHFRYVDAARAAESRMFNAMQLILRGKDLTPDEELRLRFEIGSTALEYGAPADGAAWLRSVLEIDPEHAAAHRLLADYYDRNGNDLQAAEHRRRVAPAGGDRNGS